ncbi:hypothetical protein Psed_6727 (plasmid) [Pseudonocardia dioxanivorans CB1190]|uniref:Uncharacterized protein n=1 Tax=Pseudonocardia dioxanivorans (strain ATCC 55486 / DSM 44775 / JCM 13855 / CB1190) TaxID=675635 RepID=F2L6T6_PSEUX|nr:hypothetical protein [Pseudonocardia dioxanivorans]AEA28808.1 hypothetical protein Psed_6727 [Pseudonocardia dioxanivorans CB1190]GJF03548.1 hypothetical protein PSD17_25080 [Pseudonocardia sp. D17]
MATPPKISAVERDAAIARIDRRHARIDDPRRSELGTDPRDVLEFVLNRGPVGVPRWVAAADHADALVLWTWCWWEDRRTERRLLRQGLSAGLSLADLGAPLGITTRQGVRDRLDRLSGLLEYDRPDEQLTRTARREHRARDARQAWIDDHRDEVRAVLLALLLQARRVLGDGGNAEHTAHPDQCASHPAQEWLDEVDADYSDDALTPATLAAAGLVVAELRSSDPVLSLDRHHRIHGTLRALDTLRARLAAI